MAVISVVYVCICMCVCTCSGGAQPYQREISQGWTERWWKREWWRLTRWWPLQMMEEYTEEDLVALVEVQRKSNRMSVIY